MTKLSSLLGRTVTLIGVVFLVSFAVVALSFTSVQTLQRRDKIRSLQESILMANATVREFIITRDPIFAKRTEVLLREADVVLREGIQSDNYNRLHAQVHLYLRSIGSLIDAFKARGFYEGSGLEGQIRSNLNDIEQRLRAVSASTTLVALLDIRRNEKNYILRNREDYQDGVHSGIDRMLGLLKAEDIPTAERTRMSGRLADYRHDFDELVFLTQKVEWIKTELNQLRDYLNESLSEAIEKESRQAEQRLWLSLALILLSFVLGITYAIFIAGSVVKPIGRMREVLSRLASGEHFEEMESGQYGEIADLAEAFNEVARQVKLRVSAETEVRASHVELEQKARDLEKARMESEHRATDLGLLVDELEKARIDAEQQADKRSSFLASMSHEIRTPLNGIIGMSSLLGTEDLKSDQLEIVNVIRASGESLLEIVNDILDFSKIEAGGVVLERSPLSIADGIEEAMNMVGQQAADKNLDLSYACSEDVPTDLLGDATRIRQILVNLLSNAVKFTSSGEIHIGAAVLSATPECAELQIEVRDTGIGIGSDKLATLFDPFKQAEASTTRKYGGTGLGLSIARHLCEIMDGKMWVESEPDHGSTFFFTIRLDRDAGAISEQNAAVFAKNSSVIILSQQPWFSAALKHMISTGGGTGYVVESSEEALVLLRGTTDYDAILINDGAEGVNGVAGVAIARILTDEVPDCPMILLRNLGERVTDSAVKECITKPVMRSRLSRLFAGLTHPLKVNDRPMKARRAGPRPCAERMRQQILVVDDNLVNQKVIVRMLSKLGHKADVVGSGAAALTATEESSYDVVFMDVQMPLMDGFEATRLIRDSSRVDRQPFIVALTANATSEDKKRCLDSGMDDYASKPVRTTVLEEILERALQLRRLRTGPRSTSSNVSD